MVMDNPSSHKGPSVRALIEAAGATLLYLPPYSPDFNPIENAFAKLKALLVRVVPTMADCIDAALAGLHPPSFSAARARRSLPQNRSPSRGTKKAL